MSELNVSINDSATKLMHKDGNYRSLGRGSSNVLRKGRSKIHRNHKPEFIGKTPRGIASKVVACIRYHDWCRNTDLIALRRKGYTPYNRIFDHTFRPKPMRITTRSESRESLSALSLVLAANCDYNPDSKYMFEIMLSVEEIARRMGVLHIYKNGRKAYDVLLNALRVLEQLKYIIVHRDHDADSGQNKPMRIFLTKTFFTSRGMTIENIRHWLQKYRQWAVAKGIAESIRDKYVRHQLKMTRLGINIDNYHSLKNRLKEIKRWVVRPESRAEKQHITSSIEATLINYKNKKSSSNSSVKIDCYQNAWRRYICSGKLTMAMQISLEKEIKLEFPHIHITDVEKYYRLLLERVGIFL